MPSRKRSRRRLPWSRLCKPVTRSSRSAGCVRSEASVSMRSLEGCSVMNQQSHPSDNVLSGLPAELLGSLFAKGRSVPLAGDQTLFLPGDAPDGCYRVDEGLLKVSVVTSAGGERILAILG